MKKIMLTMSDKVIEEIVDLEIELSILDKKDRQKRIDALKADNKLEALFG